MSARSTPLTLIWYFAAAMSCQSSYYAHQPQNRKHNIHKISDWHEAVDTGPGYSEGGSSRRKCSCVSPNPSANASCVNTNEENTVNKRFNISNSKKRSCQLVFTSNYAYEERAARENYNSPALSSSVSGFFNTLYCWVSRSQVRMEKLTGVFGYFVLPDVIKARHVSKSLPD